MFIIAKHRDPNVKLVHISRNRKIEVNSSCSTNGNQEIVNSESTATRNSGIRMLYSSPKPLPKSNHCFVRPEESFLSLGRGPVILSSRSSSLPDWAKCLLPPSPTTPLFRFHQKGVTDADLSKGSVGHSSSSHLPTGPHICTSSKLEAGAKKAMRFSCRTCSERLPTLNSLRTHLKSHCRPLVHHHTPQLSLDSICMQAQMVTSKYGRRRPVISASRVNKGANIL